MGKLRKRSYPALAEAGSGGKWFTGWEGFAFTPDQEKAYSARFPLFDFENMFRPGGYNKRVEEIDHETRKMSLQFSHTEKGRSSAVAVFEDKEGFEYKISFNSLELILQLLHRKRDPKTKYDISETRIQGSGTWIEGTFMQVKKGQNYFIEPVEVGNA